jgi:hypothetical protein
MSGNYEGPSINPRFQVQRPGGPYLRVVWDTYLNEEAARFYGSETDAHESGEAIQRRTQLLAETRASELNLQSQDPLRFVEVLAAHISESLGGGTPGREVLEDVSIILEHYAGRLRGTRTAPIPQNLLHAPAAWLETL